MASRELVPVIRPLIFRGSTLTRAMGVNVLGSIVGDYVDASDIATDFWQGLALN